MMRTHELLLRRQALLARCEAQRAELSFRVGRVLPKSLRGVVSGQGPGSSAPRHPLAWLATLAGLVVFGRARELLTFFVVTRSALNVLSRATTLMSLFSTLRGRRRAKAKV
jgi:hypothetical protein